MKNSIVLSENRAEKFEGVWIPKEIYLNNDLKAEEKILISEIISLCKLESGCVASNKHFANFLGTSERTARDYIQHLEELGFIKRKLIYKKDSKEIEKRIITLTDKIYESNNRGYGENSPEGMARNCLDKSTLEENNNLLNELNSSEELLSKSIGKKFDEMTETEKMIETERWRNEVLPKVIYGICTHDSFFKHYPHYDRKIPENYIETIISAIQEYTYARERKNGHYMIFSNNSIKKAIDQIMLFSLDERVCKNHIMKYVFSEMIERFFDTKTKTLGYNNLFHIGMFFNKKVLIVEYAAVISDSDMRREVFEAV